MDFAACVVQFGTFGSLIELKNMPLSRLMRPCLTRSCEYHLDVWFHSKYLESVEFTGLTYPICQSTYHWCVDLYFYTPFSTVHV